VDPNLYESVYYALRDGAFGALLTLAILYVLLHRPATKLLTLTVSCLVALRDCAKALKESSDRRELVDEELIELLQGLQYDNSAPRRSLPLRTDRD
jgi:hypothetical protein